MLKVLLLAPTIDAHDIGEAWVAYQWAHHLSAMYELTVLTYRKRGSTAVAAQLPLARVIEWEEPPLLGRAERLNSLMKPGYFAFYVRARRWIRRALGRGERFDVAHQPLPVAMRYPSPLAGLPIPFLIGPVGGGLTTPPGFEAEDTAPWYVSLRRLDSVRLRADPLLRRTFTSASCVLGIAPYVAQALGHLPLKRLELISETGLTALPEVLGHRSSSGPLRLLFVGRVIRTKGTRDLVAALGLLGDQPVVADVVGSGFDLQACADLADKLGVADKITFHGTLPRGEIDAFYRSADVFVFPSFREPGGNVVFEAMGHALPMIINDRGGPAAAADDACAVRIPAHSPHQYAADIAAAIREFADDPARRLAMGQAARQRVEEVGLWSAKIAKIGQLYSEVAAEALDS